MSKTMIWKKELPVQIIARADVALQQRFGSQAEEAAPQAIGQRHTPKLVDFLQNLLVEAAKVAVGSDKALAPIWNSFRA
jgi:hypothetical protein